LTLAEHTTSTIPCIKKPSGDRLLHEDTRVPVLLAAMGLDIAEARIKAEVLDHQRVRVQPDPAQSMSASLIFGERQEPPSITLSLSLWSHGYIVEKHCLALGYENKDTDHSTIVDHIDTPLVDEGRVVILHGTRLFADAGNITAVGSMHDDLYLSEVGGCGRSDHGHHSMMVATRQRINKARVL
jgi:hypothetical protein